MENRPKSPYLTVYKAQTGSLLSIFSRISGILLTLFLITFIIFQTFLKVFFVSLGGRWLVIVLFLDIFNFLPLGIIVYFLMVLFFYHLIFSIRYIIWFVQGGKGPNLPLELSTHYRITLLILICSILFSLYFWLIF